MKRSRANSQDKSIPDPVTLPSTLIKLTSTVLDSLSKHPPPNKTFPTSFPLPPFPSVQTYSPPPLLPSLLSFLSSPLTSPPSRAIATQLLHDLLSPYDPNTWPVEVLESWISDAIEKRLWPCYPSNESLVVDPLCTKLVSSLTSTIPSPSSSSSSSSSPTCSSTPSSTTITALLQTRITTNQNLNNTNLLTTLLQLVPLSPLLRSFTSQYLEFYLSSAALAKISRRVYGGIVEGVDVTSSLDLKTVRNLLSMRLKPHLHPMIAHTFTDVARRCTSPLVAKNIFSVLLVKEFEDIMEMNDVLLEKEENEGFHHAAKEKESGGDDYSDHHINSNKPDNKTDKDTKSSALESSTFRLRLLERIFVTLSPEAKPVESLANGVLMLLQEARDLPSPDKATSTTAPPTPTPTPKVTSAPKLLILLRRLLSVLHGSTPASQRFSTLSFVSVLLSPTASTDSNPNSMKLRSYRLNLARIAAVATGYDHEASSMIEDVRDIGLEWCSYAYGNGVEEEVALGRGKRAAKKKIEVDSKRVDDDGFSDDDDDNSSSSDDDDSSVASTPPSVPTSFILTDSEPASTTGFSEQLSTVQFFLFLPQSSSSISQFLGQDCSNSNSNSSNSSNHNHNNNNNNNNSNNNNNNNNSEQISHANPTTIRQLVQLSKRVAPLTTHVLKTLLEFPSSILPSEVKLALVERLVCVQYSNSNSNTATPILSAPNIILPNLFSLCAHTPPNPTIKNPAYKTPQAKPFSALALTSSFWRVCGLCLLLGGDNKNVAEWCWENVPTMRKVIGGVFVGFENENENNFNNNDYSGDDHDEAEYAKNITKLEKIMFDLFTPPQLKKKSQR